MGDSAMNCVLLLPILAFAVLISSADAARAPEPGFPNAFQQPASVFRARRQQQQQPGVLGCLTPCTRELRPVRGHQGGREKILPNPCTFQAAQCQARRTRGTPEVKDPNWLVSLSSPLPCALSDSPLPPAVFAIERHPQK